MFMQTVQLAAHLCMLLILTIPEANNHPLCILYTDPEVADDTQKLPVSAAMLEEYEK